MLEDRAKKGRTDTRDYVTSQPPPPTLTAVSPPSSDQKRNPGVISFARPTDPDWTPVPLPDYRDNLKTIANKMEALADVVIAGDSMMIWTDGKMLIGWDAQITMKNAGAEGNLTYQELAELQTMKVLNVAITRENQVRAELNKLMRDLEASRKVLQRRKKEMKSKIRARQATSDGRKRKRV